jgi:hypothetical protein
MSIHLQEIPLNAAHSACETIQIAQKTSRL